jgi:hypothetical protein
MYFNLFLRHSASAQGQQQGQCALSIAYCENSQRFYGMAHRKDINTLSGNKFSFGIISSKAGPAQ